jgi:hypothetical protein
VITIRMDYTGACYFINLRNLAVGRKPSVWDKPPLPAKFFLRSNRQSLEIYSRLSLAVAQEEYDYVIRKFAVVTGFEFDS